MGVTTGPVNFLNPLSLSILIRVREPWADLVSTLEPKLCQISMFDSIAAFFFPFIASICSYYSLSSSPNFLVLLLYTSSLSSTWSFCILSRSLSPIDLILLMRPLETISLGCSTFLTIGFVYNPRATLCSSICSCFDFMGSGGGK